MDPSGVVKRRMEFLEASINNFKYGCQITESCADKACDIDLRLINGKLSLECYESDLKDGLIYDYGPKSIKRRISTRKIPYDVFSALDGNHEIKAALAEKLSILAQFGYDISQIEEQLNSSPSAKVVEDGQAEVGVAATLKLALCKATATDVNAVRDWEFLKKGKLSLEK